MNREEDIKKLIEQVKSEEKKEQFYEEGKFVPKKLANYLMNVRSFKTTKDTKEILYYNDGTYHDGGEVLISGEVERFLQEDVKTYFVNEVIGCIKRSTYFDRKYMNPLNMICLENGIYNIDTEEFTKHTPDIVFTIQLPVNYDPKADCPTFKNLLQDVLREQDILMMEELFGYCLYRKYSIKKAFIWYGETDSGKTTLMNVLIKFIGKENIESIPFRKFYKSFLVANLKDKHLNVVDDMSARVIEDTSTFNKLCGNSFISTNVKYVQKSLKFYSYAKMISALNVMPPVAEDTPDAYFNRIIKIPFPYRFVDEPKAPNEKMKIPRELLEEELYKDKEMSGILNLVLVGLRRLLKNYKFTGERSLDEKREDYISMTNPVLSFLNENIVFESDSHVTNEEIFYNYVNFCNIKGFASVSQTSFDMKFRKIYATEIINEKIKEGRFTTSRKKGWYGIRLKTEDKHKKKQQLEGDKQTTIPSIPSVHFPHC